MAELQMRLKQYEKAEKTVTTAMENEVNAAAAAGGGGGGGDLNSLMQQAKFYTLLATIHQRSGNTDAALRTLGSFMFSLLIFQAWNGKI